MSCEVQENKPADEFTIVTCFPWGKTYMNTQKENNQWTSCAKEIQNSQQVHHLGHLLPTAESQVCLLPSLVHLLNEKCILIRQIVKQLYNIQIHLHTVGERTRELGFTWENETSLIFSLDLQRVISTLTAV